MSDDLRRLLVFVALCAGVALLVVDLARPPDAELRVGDVAERTVKSPLTFSFPDHAGYERAREAAREAAPPVYVLRTDLVEDRHERIRQAFAAGRGRVAELGGGALTEDLELLVVQSFLDPLRVQLADDDVRALIHGGFSRSTEDLAHRLFDQAMQDAMVVVSRDQLPSDRRPLVLIRLGGEERSESVVTDLDAFVVPETVRQRVSLSLMNAKVATGPATDAAAGLARALVTANVSYDPLETEERREAAAAAVPLGLITVKRGQILLAAGQVVTPDDLELYTALQQQSGEHDPILEALALALFYGMLIAAIYHFASSWLAGFSTRVRDVAAGAGLLLLVTLLARVTVASSEAVATIVGYEAEARSVWFLVPAAGTVMLVRLLLGVPWTLPFVVAAAAACGLVMDLQALPVVFFLVSGAAAASAVEHTRERIAVVRAGAAVGVVNAVAVLLIHLVQLFVSEGELSLATTMRPFWSMTFAFTGGLLSSFLVLGLVPLFESAGFVTDYRLMELANLNHPLLRQLMLRAPGSYHHSVIVGTLAEAGAEAIGANALVAKVASYFHDIGKSLKPQYFVENQHGVNKHSELTPEQSAAVIIAHVVEGGRMAREHRLPQPIVDNIYMHHGTGLLQYFYAEASEREGRAIDETPFRYPGPKPNTREAGVIMLADKVEAATRTLRTPDEAHIQAMIGRIVSSVVADGQFSECPLTLQEIHTVADTFVRVLVAIYHQRIEYPQTADLSRSVSHAAAAAEVPREATITLEMSTKQVRPQSSQHTPAPVPERTAPSEAAEAAEPDPVDYEAVEHLPLDVARPGSHAGAPPRERGR
ncbi:MAG: HDIG domain-containing protein [Alphaproteobacteria bacterium]|nr:HDIG domain-containing protein [Alphaproteobacteria bacterium]